MGTSKSLKTPAGGAWTSPKRQLTNHITGQGQTDGGAPFDAQRFVRSALGALGGVGLKPQIASRSDGSSSVGGGGALRGRSRRGGVGGGASSGGGALSGAVQGLGGFGTQVVSGGLDTALGTLGLQDLRGRTAAEVVAQVAQHLSRDATGRQAEVLETALRDVIFDIAAVEDAGSYEDLEGALQSFIDREGIEGFIESFLSQDVFTAVWSYFENHAKSKADGAADEALVSAVESACRSLVSQELKALQDTQQFERIDWFGTGGKNFADRIVSQLQSNLTAPE
jgi:hypothetical protein